MAYLKPDEVDALVQATMRAGLGNNAARNTLLSALNQRYVGGLFDVGGNAMYQLYNDLNAMNAVDQLSDGSVPLRDWLQKAGTLARMTQRPEEEVFTRYATLVEAKASGQQQMPDPATLREVINNEDIVFRDDMVDFLFLSAGALAGRSVAKLSVPRYENGAPALNITGQQRRSVGTGWLIAKDLVVTNHHVVKSRLQGEPAPNNADLLLQGSHTLAKFDYDDANSAGEDVAASVLEAWDETLDFAILRLSRPAPYDPLQINKLRVVFSEGVYVPVNIIQHPSGQPKRVALRNNLLTSTDATTVRYFTDTLTGSSGSPVFDDAWRVIALHRGSQAVQNVSYQGRDAAVVNVGTQITAILDYLAAKHPALHQEIQNT